MLIYCINVKMKNLKRKFNFEFKPHLLDRIDMKPVE